MQGPFHSTSGIAYPGDLKLLNEVFDRMCIDYGFRKGSPEAEDVGRAAMSLFSAGVFEEEVLVASLKEYLNRKAWRAERRTG